MLFLAFRVSENIYVIVSELLVERFKPTKNLIDPVKKRLRYSQGNTTQHTDLESTIMASKTGNINSAYDIHGDEEVVRNTIVPSQFLVYIKIVWIE